MPAPIAGALLLGFTTYLIGKISTGRNAPSQRAEPAPVPVSPPPKVVPVVAPPKAVEPPPKPPEAAPPPPPPPPPPDTSTKLPTPPPVAVVEPPPPAPVVKAPPPPVAVVEPPPKPVEVAPPVAPEPPPDPSPTLPTPKPERPLSDAVVEVDAPYYSAPPSSSSTTPAPTPAPSAGPPAGFDGTLASTLAPNVSRDIAKNGYNFSREGLRAFQRAAGVAVDGVYGDDSWGALLYFTSDAPKALYKPNLPTPYPWGKWVSAAPSSSSSVVSKAPTAAVDATPPTLPAPPDTAANVGPLPPAGFNPATARKLAKQVAANLDSKGKANYGRDLMKQFQTAAGIDADGLYGGGTRRALIYFGVARPPQPFFKPTATPPDYPWAAQASS